MELAMSLEEIFALLIVMLTFGTFALKLVEVARRD
jgi:hypothetical protein